MSVVKGGGLEMAGDLAIRVLSIPGMGRGLFATRCIPAQATVLEEAPIVSTPPISKVRDGSWCRRCCSPGYACGHEPAKSSWDLSPLLEYCEERRFKWPMLMAQLAARTLRTGAKTDDGETLGRMKFLCSVNLKGREARLEEQRRVLLDCFRRPSDDKVLSIDWYVDLYSRIQANAFRLDLVDSPALGGGQLSYQAVLRSMLAQQEGGDGGSAVYTVASLFNHSCVPNVDVSFPMNDHTIVLRTNQDVGENEQLTVGYADIDADVEERASRLAMYGFQCECEKCREER